MVELAIEKPTHNVLRKEYQSGVHHYDILAMTSKVESWQVVGANKKKPDIIAAFDTKWDADVV